MSVYLCQIAGGGRIKIGMTDGDVPSRMRALGGWHPEHIECLAVIEGGKLRERVLQMLLADCAYSAEWFNGCPKTWRLVLDAIDTQLSWLIPESATNGLSSATLLRRFGTAEAIAEASGITTQSALLGLRVSGLLPVSIKAAWAISEMKRCRDLPDYLDRPAREERAA
jgi:hypothetical protein